MSEKTDDAPIRVRPASRRIGDNDRLAASTLLSDALVSGHLDLHTFEQRQHALGAAVTAQDLDDLFTDIDLTLPWNGQPDFQALSEKAWRILSYRPMILTGLFWVGVAVIIMAFNLGDYIGDRELLPFLVCTICVLGGLLLLSVTGLVYFETRIRNAMRELKPGKDNRWTYYDPFDWR